MAKLDISTKRLAIVKANGQMVAIVAVAAFITIFCLVASKAVFSQNQYQQRVISAKEKAHVQLTANTKAFGELVKHYKAFDSKSSNVIGGDSNGNGDNDGRNSKLILDALPPSYDFPALASSLEKVLTDRNFKISDITGTDDQINQQTNASSPKPEAVAMPFSFSVSNTNYSSIQDLVKALQNSIRPLVIDSIDLSGGANDMTATIKAHSFYQPAKNLNITKKAIK